MQRLPDHMRAMLSTRNPSDQWCKRMETNLKEPVAYYAAIVATMLQKEYGITVWKMSPIWYQVRIDRYLNAGDDYATAAFKIANEHQMLNKPFGDEHIPY